jgi:hypothetical protein
LNVGEEVGTSGCVVTATDEQSNCQDAVEMTQRGTRGRADGNVVAGGGSESLTAIGRNALMGEFWAQQEENDEGSERRG